MLMVTTSVRMVDGIHSNTASPGPIVALGLVLVHSTGSLEHRLVGPCTTRHNADHSTSRRRDDLLGARRKLHTGPASIDVVTDDGNVVARCPTQRATVTSLLLDVGNNGTLGHGAERKNISNGQRSLLSSVDELACVHSLVGDKTVSLVC